VLALRQSMADADPGIARVLAPCFGEHLYRIA
jgi:hypothetical protein